MNKKEIQTDNNTNNEFTNSYDKANILQNCIV